MVYACISSTERFLLQSQFIAKLRKEKGYTKIGAVGYCYGGGVGALIAKSPELVDTVVIAHPGGVTVDVVKAIKVPACWVCAEGAFKEHAARHNTDSAFIDDMGFKPAARNAAEAVFKAREGKDDFIPYEFKDWKGAVT